MPPSGCHVLTCDVSHMTLHLAVLLVESVFIQEEVLFWKNSMTENRENMG